MSFTLFPGHNAYPDWDHWMKNRIGTSDKVEDNVLSAPTATDNNNNYSTDKNGSSAYKVINPQQAALDTKRAFKAKVTLPLPHTDVQHERHPSAPPLDTCRHNDGTTPISKLKSSLRQLELAQKSSQQRPCNNKSVKFNPLHLEKICLFEESQSPSEVPNFDQIKLPLFKVVYSQWPPLQNILFRQQQNVQLKRTLKITEDGPLLHGQVVVRNLGYEKVVEIRYTFDGWQTVKNTQAIYLHGRGPFDVFAFDLDIQQGMVDRGQLRATLDMAVRYTVKATTNDSNDEKTFWDNNDGHNYQVQIAETVINQLETVSSSSQSNTSITTDESKNLDDNTYHLLSSSCTSSRYNFGRSLLKAKLNVSPSSLPPSPPPSPISPSSSSTLNSFTLINDTSTNAGLGSLEKNACQLDPPLYSGDYHPIVSSSYSDLVNKYCFYGSQ